MTPVHEQALLYAALGWSVVPIRPGTKVPPMKGWQNAATSDPAKIAKWWGGVYLNCGLGIGTGQTSGVWVLDIDADHGGVEALQALVAQFGPLPKGPRVNTPSGGFHLYFLNPQGTHVATTKNIGGQGIDVRGDGGQVLAPPTIHPNGLPYVWADSRSPWDVQLVAAPDWLLDIVVPKEPEPVVAPPALDLTSGPLTANIGSAAAEITAAFHWHKLLADDGWSLASKQNNGDTQWTRPGKDPRLGVSAILHEPEGPLVNYSTEAVNLCQMWARNDTSDCWSYSIYGYLAATRYNGDRSLIAQEWVANRTAFQVDEWSASSGGVQPGLTQGGSTETPSLVDENDLSFAHLLEWPAFWAQDHTAQEWVLWPFIPKGRSVALFALAKQGKSTILLAAVAAAACGAKVFGRWETEPVDVLYLDYEMTEADVWERLHDQGYGPEDDLSHLHYALLPSMFPLDTRQGADQIVRLAQSVNAQVVVIDTFSRAVQGDENDADTSRDFYRFTGMALKALGIACLRTDHAGKEIDKGQRGSSAKNDDVDVVWSLSRSEAGVTVKRTHSRVTWVPDIVQLEQVESDDGSVSYRVSDRRQYVDGTRELAMLMDRLGIPLKASGREAARLLREAGEGAKNDRVRQAQQYRESMATSRWVEPVAVSGDPNAF